MKILLSIFVLLFSSSVFAENYYCSYLYDGESDIIEFNRIDNSNFNVGVILDENNNFIYIGSNVQGFGHEGYRISIIDKNTKKFRMMVLYNPEDDGEQSAIIEGYCVLKN